MLVGAVGGMKSVCTAEPIPVPATAVCAVCEFRLSSVCTNENARFASCVSVPSSVLVKVPVVPDTLQDASLVSIVPVHVEPDSVSNVTLTISSRIPSVLAPL